MKEQKTWKDFNEQLSLLKEKGLIIEDEKNALGYLKTICLINIFPVSNRQGKYYQFTISYITNNPIVAYSIPPFSTSIPSKSFAFYSWIFAVL
ncbi:hypothetical protein HNR69_000766 [Histophilus somni]|nr:hypothetical protein [Histophilus somni]